MMYAAHTTEELTPQPPLYTADDGPLCLQVLYSTDTDAIGSVHLLERSIVQIGRAGAGDRRMTIDDGKLSRSHADITWCPAREKYLIVDRSSRNGTALNGVKTSREVLHVGDLIRMGNTVLRFSRADSVVSDWRAPDDSLLVGRSVHLCRLLAHVERAAPSSVAVLLLGETGTGKELAARRLHDLSGRTGPFRAINCAAIAPELITSELFGHTKGAFSGADAAREGLFRSANGGTVFLDEVGELSAAQQAKLLRVLDTQRVLPVGASVEVGIDVRIVAATNRDLRSKVESGEFRADLYARLAEWVVNLAPLRDRPDDLHDLVVHFLDCVAPGIEYRMAGELFERLALHSWPFNVRELRSIVRRIALLVPDGGEIDVAHLPDELGNSPASRSQLIELPPPLTEPTARELRGLAEELSGNVKAMAEFAGKGREQIYRWLRRYDIDPNVFRRR
jgi:transcriptional regulator with PAS, ATPase and Fis domain